MIDYKQQTVYSDNGYTKSINIQDIPEAVENISIAIGIVSSSVIERANKIACWDCLTKFLHRTKLIINIKLM